MQNVQAEDWIDWALEMMMAGFESEHLIELAGISPQTNRFQLDDVINKTLKELSLDKTTNEQIINGYVYYLISEAIDQKSSTKKVLRELRDLCQFRDYDKKLFPFYLLYYAHDELETLDVQYYWEGAEKQNIDAIIFDEFQRLKMEYETSLQSSEYGK